MAKYTTIPIDLENVSGIRKSWEELAGADAFDLEFSPTFSWVETHMSVTANDSVALCLWNNDCQRADAIVEIVSSRDGQLSKLLKIVPSPYFWDVNARREEIIQLYIEVFFNAITSGGFGKSRKVKLYGRDDEMMSILRSIHAHWAIPNSQAEFEGRFLAICIN